MKNIVALTIWYDEHPDDLSRMCRSLGGFVTGMVALDGAFETFPTDQRWSPSEQIEALADGCAFAGIQLLAYQPASGFEWPGGYLGNEVEKRNSSLHMARILDAEWVVAVDADMELMPGWSDAFDLEMFDTDLVVAETLTAGSPLRNMFRWTPTLRYVDSHFALTDGPTLVAWPREISTGNQMPTTTKVLADGVLAKSLDLTRYVRFAHHPKRTALRRAQQNLWYVQRDAMGLENTR